MLDYNTLYRSLDAFASYSEDVQETIIRPRFELVQKLSEHDRKLIRDLFIKKVSHLQNAISSNAKIAEAVYQHSVLCLKEAGLNLSEPDQDVNGATADDQAIARHSIRQIWRDWSSEAEHERSACHDPVVKDVLDEFRNVPDWSTVRILVPGAGLCRLPFKLAALGLSVEANELSYQQILLANFILSQRGTQLPTPEGSPNHMEDDRVSTDGNARYTIFPWAYQFSNHRRRSDQFRGYSVPEINPADELEQLPVLREVGDHLSLQTKRLIVVSKDFQRDYVAPEYKGAFDAVATVFFVDTAPNVLQYIRTVHHTLKPGGIWINVGPLLWNCYENGPAGRREGDPDDDNAAKARQPKASHDSIPDINLWDEKLEFAFDEILELTSRMGFTVENSCNNLISAGYIMDPDAMLQSEYQLGYWRVRKC